MLVHVLPKHLVIALAFVALVFSAAVAPTAGARGPVIKPSKARAYAAAADQLVRWASLVRAKGIDKKAQSGKIVSCRLDGQWAFCLVRLFVKGKDPRARLTILESTETATCRITSGPTTPGWGSTVPGTYSIPCY